MHHLPRIFKKNVSKRLSKIFVLFLTLLLVFSYNFFSWEQFLTIDYLKKNVTDLQLLYTNSKIETAVIFFLIYVITTSLSFPGATILSLAGGMIFGFAKGLIIISFASTIGATLAFLLSRYLFKDYVQKKFSPYMSTINSGIKKDGPFYLFSLRLVPMVPFFAINLTLGLTPIKASTFYLISQIAMLPGTALYVNAGLELSKINSIDDVLSFKFVLSFSLLGIFPLLAKKLINSRKKKVL